ncbi:HYC_CC_PP family protein [Polaribacter sp. SA4-12]|uniref:HYC_CC_PP family protein n=1 Tax=Polaribacter sp. SA4-12 TaxID=1312072 RepID=UPI000B3D3671|nr:hypothetical protein [Polaribacter sp. SA4-12]ARV16389.1 hypothetical protein BTO07_15155 [Polaribacter sp. SA4-12]
MKQIFSKISSFSLVLLVFFSTFSFTVEKHFCGDFLMDVSFIGHADDCGMDMGKVSSKKKNCCKDEVHHIEGQDELQQTSADEFNFSKQQFLVSFYISYNDLFIENESKKTTYKDASPPDIPLDYQVLYQSFLI